jgi:acyl-CoA hydrolase
MTGANATLRELDSLDAAVDRLIAAVGPHLIIAAPLGIGKPHRLLNAIYRRVETTPSLSLLILTALSLTPPTPSSDLERRFLGPFLERHFGKDFVTLDYATARKRDSLPANVQVEEFYMQSGDLLGSTQAQRRYASLNYTHVARTVAERGANALVQKVAREPGGTRLSLSSNPDLTFDFVDECARIGRPRPFLIAEVDPELPWLDGPCAVDADYFDVVVEPPGPYPKLFALPRQPVSDADHAIGLYASALVRDGGTLQIGIGSLADALCHALVLRHTRNDDYRRVITALSPAFADSPLVAQCGGLAPFKLGLYGASEMVNDGFRALAQAGILTRRVVDDADAMRRLNRDEATADDLALREREGRWLDGAFYLGSTDLYQWLRDLPADQARGIGMTRVSQVNQIYGGHEALEREQRRDARFFNTCMMMTALGAAVSDGLDDGRIVSGVGGQYNFVAMAHALDDGRSALMCRATRELKGRGDSNIRWNYGHTTIPRHLRDIAITEYGVANLRGACDEDCVIAMAAITDTRFQASLIDAAKKARKLDPKFEAPAAWRDNTPESLRNRLSQFRRSGVLPDYPLGCDFTPVEQDLVRALAWLKSATATPVSTLRTIAAALATRRTGDTGSNASKAALQHMSLSTPRNVRERLYGRLILLALEKGRNW